MKRAVFPQRLLRTTPAGAPRVRRPGPHVRRAHLDDTDGGGVDGGGLGEVVQVVDPHGQDLGVTTGR